MRTPNTTTTTAAATTSANALCRAFRIGRGSNKSIYASTRKLSTRSPTKTTTTTTTKTTTTTTASRLASTIAVVQDFPPPPRRFVPSVTAPLPYNPVTDADVFGGSQDSSKTLTYTGGKAIPITSTLRLVLPEDDVPRGVWPVLRFMDESGEFLDPNATTKQYQSPMLQSNNEGTSAATETIERDDLPKLRTVLSKLYPYHRTEIVDKNLLLRHNSVPYLDTDSTNTLLRAHRQMVRIREMDDILLNAQRQGRISFYLTCRGEEAIHVGAASALDLGDVVLAQYREQGVLMWRGFTLDQFLNQCLSNDMDLGKGRQMPVHYGSRALNYHTISSPLGTQLPQAVGVAYRLKLGNVPNVAVCFFGEGAASTTDFHSALNFAATLSAPVLFFCRNNGYAISTPTNEQYRGDGIISRAPGYGMAAIRVDGNDVFAVHAAVREAKEYALRNNAPVLIEAMTYRLGHHSTSDDSTTYRSIDEVRNFEDQYDPLLRFENFLLKHCGGGGNSDEENGGSTSNNNGGSSSSWISKDDMKVIRQEERSAVLQSLEKAERRPKPALNTLFDDVYSTMPKNLQQQKEELHKHMELYPK